MSLSLSILALLGIGLFIAFMWLIALPGKYRVEESIEIAAPLETCFNYLADFRNWPAFSPWIMHEPDCPLTFSTSPAPNQQGGSYSWDGKYIGAGSMTHEFIEPNRLMVMQLKFLRPFRSRASVGFECSELGGATKITWTMDSKVPLFFRPMLNMLKQSIASDYQLGLYLLRNQLDPSAEVPDIQFLGVTQREQTRYLYKEWSGDLRDVPTAMQVSFPALIEQLAQAGLEPAGAPFTIYTKMKFTSDSKWFNLRMCVPVADETDCSEIPSDIVPGGRYFHGQLTGSYQFLGCAWNSVISHARMHKQGVRFGKPCLELYETDPDQVANQQELVTSIFLPLRGA